MLFLLDTNILLAFIRLGLLGLYLDVTYRLYTLQPSPLVSIVTEAELRALALKHNRDFEPLHGRYLQCEWVNPASRIQA